MASLSGKTALVTGATSGIGLEASVGLAKLGARVVMVARDEKKAEQALAGVKARGGASVSTMLCDFSSQAQVRRLATEVAATHDGLDILVNNAGAVSASRQLTEDGIEQTFAVNHLGYFLLTTRLLDLLQRGPSARIINVSSTGHYSGTLDFSNLQFERGGYHIMRAYNRSKLANVAFTVELARRLAGTGVTVNALHPGVVATGIWARAPWYARPLLELGKLFMISPEEGGSRIVYLAASDEVEGKSGGFYDNNRLRAPARIVGDEAVTKQLWAVSEALTAPSAVP